MKVFKIPQPNDLNVLPLISESPIIVELLLESLDPENKLTLTMMMGAGDVPFEAIQKLDNYIIQQLKDNYISITHFRSKVETSLGSMFDVTHTLTTFCGIYMLMLDPYLHGYDTYIFETRLEDLFWRIEDEMVPDHFSITSDSISDNTLLEFAKNFASEYSEHSEEQEIADEDDDFQSDYEPYDYLIEINDVSYQKIDGKLIAIVEV